MAAETMTVLEDIYLPYRPKRRTRATIAKEKGLEPLAKLLLEQGSFDITTEAAKFINAEKAVESVEDALAGARDIIAEWVSENQEARAAIRSLYQKKGQYVCKVITGKEEEAVKYKDYYDWSEPVASAPSHRVLAMRRGEKEKFLLLRVTVDEEQAVSILDSLFVKNQTAAGEQVMLAVRDGYKRLIMLSMETEIRLESKKKADEEAIQGLCGKPPATAAQFALRRKKYPRHRPGFSNRVQSGVPGPAGQTAVSRCHPSAEFGQQRLSVKA